MKQFDDHIQVLIAQVLATELDLILLDEVGKNHACDEFIDNDYGADGTEGGCKTKNEA